MFNDDTTLFKKGQDNVITTKERRETRMWRFLILFSKIGEI